MRRDRLYAWLVAHPTGVDAGVAALLALALAVPFALSRELGFVLSLLLIAPLAWRRSSPTLTVVLVAAAAFLQWLVALRWPQWLALPADVAVLIALYAVAAYGPRWASRLGLATGLLGAVLMGAAVGWSRGGFDPAAAVSAVLGVGALALAAWLLGDLRRIRRAYVASLEERAERLELEREQESRLAAAAERARIAREMHDVVAHSLSVVIAQADGGRYAASASPRAAEGALATIADTGRTALADMRRLLGVLRDDAAAPTSPQPGVAAVPALVESVRASGLPVSLVQVGAARALPPGLELAVFRIAQEGLTNVLKHAGPGTPTTVSLRWTADTVEVQVDDEGTGSPGGGPGSDGPGHGITGMRERARLYGGTVTAGPKDGVGFRLCARLPYPEGS